jgi:hypothetical protein
MFKLLPIGPYQPINKGNSSTQLKNNRLQLLLAIIGTLFAFIHNVRGVNFVLYPDCVSIQALD